MKAKKLGLIKNDPWLQPYAEAIEGRHKDAKNKEADLLGRRPGKKCGTLVDFANAYQYFGLHKLDDGSWVFREWAPNATSIILIGQFSDWQEQQRYALHRLDNGVWEVKLPPSAIHNGDYYKMLVRWNGGQGERIPAYARRVVQDDKTHIFSAQVWEPEEPYRWKVEDFKPDTKPLLIYECHVGMAQEKEGLGTYTEFRDNILPISEQL